MPAQNAGAVWPLERQAETRAAHCSCIVIMHGDLRPDAHSAKDGACAADTVYVHCGAGCGRAGVFASCLLGLHGAEPLDAIGRFRAIRGCGPETPEQVAYVVRHAGRGLEGA